MTRRWYRTAWDKLPEEERQRLTAELTAKLDAEAAAKEAANPWVSPRRSKGREGYDWDYTDRGTLYYDDELTTRGR